MHALSKLSLPTPPQLPPIVPLPTPPTQSRLKTSSSSRLPNTPNLSLSSKRKQRKTDHEKSSPSTKHSTTQNSRSSSSLDVDAVSLLESCPTKPLLSAHKNRNTERIKYAHERISINTRGHISQRSALSSPNTDHMKSLVRDSFIQNQVIEQVYFIYFGILFYYFIFKKKSDLKKKNDIRMQY